MHPIDWTAEQPSRLQYDAQHFASARAFVFERWCELAGERGLARPQDLSGACKYGSLFVQQVFGGTIRGHFEHQFNRIGGRIVDLSHDALDVGRMSNPYLHERDFFSVPEVQRSLAGCLPRATRWADEFMSAVE